MNSKDREKIFKSWSGISEVNLIKEVATKGENISLAQEYWAIKKKITISEYESLFCDVVREYVERLLNERLVCKAENVLRNVRMDVRCFYYQFACETKDGELKDMVMEHLNKRDPTSTEYNLDEMHFYWELLQQIKEAPQTQAKCISKLKRLNIENLLKVDKSYFKRLLAELYLEKGNAALLQHLDKLVLWEILVENQQQDEIISWCCKAEKIKENAVVNNCVRLNLSDMYDCWPLESVMFEIGLKSLSKPNEVLRNCFAKQGFFFEDERNELQIILRRICTTESFAVNKEVIVKLPLGRFLLERGFYVLLLEDFVDSHELEVLMEEFPTHATLLKLIVTLKENDMKQREGFKNICQSTKTYLEMSCNVPQNDQPLAIFHEFLCNEPTSAALKCFLQSPSGLQRIPYLQALVHRMDANANNQLPTAYDLLRKFKHIDFRKLICQDNQEVASFSNERLCQKYARKYQINFLHYLKQHRSAYAVYYLLTDQLQQYAQLTKTQLFSACEAALELITEVACNTEQIVHCVAFCEYLGFDSQSMRSFLKLTRLLQQPTGFSFKSILFTIESKLLAVLQQNPQQFPLADYEALIRLILSVHLEWPYLILQHYALEDDWFHLLVLCQYFDIPLKDVKWLLPYFKTSVMGQNLLRALSQDTLGQGTHCKRQTSFNRHQQKKKFDNLPTTSSISVETLNSHSEQSSTVNSKSFQFQHQRFLPDASGNLDIFAIILLSNSSESEEKIESHARFMDIMQNNSNEKHSTSNNLMKYAVKYQMPVLCVFASSVSDLNVEWHWVTWLALYTSQWNTVADIKDLNDLAWHLIENSVRLGCSQILQRSFNIFFEQYALNHIAGFLHSTQNLRDFGEETILQLRLYLLAWSNDEISLPLCTSHNRDQLMKRSIKLLLLHLQHNFDSTLEQEKFLTTICLSDMSDISGSGMLDFCHLNKVFHILQSSAQKSQKIQLNFEQILQNSNDEYARILQDLIEEKEYDMAVQLSSLLSGYPIADIIYEKWVHNFELQQQQADFDKFEADIEMHSLPPEILINFCLFAASRLDSQLQKYLIFKKALGVIKEHHLFPNESFNRDQIEYEMILCYLQIEEDISNLKIYHSEYYEQIMIKERCVIYKSFMELKELAGMDDLTVNIKMDLSEEMLQKLESLLNSLLDEGDIVEALRLQELFQCRPIDLRFVVFCMALAEGVTTIFSMSSEDRKLLSEVEKSSYAKFNKRTLDMASSSQGHSSPLKHHHSEDLSDSCSTLEFEEIPSKEKRETLETIQGIVSRLKYGINIGKRIVMTYRAAMYLDKEYLDVLRTKETGVLLKSAAEEGCLHKLLVVSDIFNSHQLDQQEIADIMAFEIVTSIVRPRFYILNTDQYHNRNSFQNAPLFDHNIDKDLHLFLELIPNTSKLGKELLKYCDALKLYRKFQDNKPFEPTESFEKLSEIIEKYGVPTTPISSNNLSNHNNMIVGALVPLLSHKKQHQIYVELLIKAHQCFVHECSMEGIVRVLHRAKSLNNSLSQAKSWSLIVRLLIGIARYREMFYCFDTLIENEQFESLLGQFEEQKSLRQAILTHLREYYPNEKGRSLLKLAALHFVMSKELAEMWEQDAQTVIEEILTTYQVDETIESIAKSVPASKVLISRLKCSAEMLKLLKIVLENYTHATENYLMDNKLLPAQKSASLAELIAMQCDLATKAMTQSNLCICVINIQSRDEFRELINSQLSVPQALILSRACEYDINWSEVLLTQFIILQREEYLQEYLNYFCINDGVIENIIKGYQMYAQKHKPARQMEKLLSHLVEMVKSVTLKYKLASLLSLKSTVMNLLSNDQTMHYLRDTNYGKNENPKILLNN